MGPLWCIHACSIVLMACDAALGLLLPKGSEGSEDGSQIPCAFPHLTRRQCSAAVPALYSHQPSPHPPSYPPLLHSLPLSAGSPTPLLTDVCMTLPPNQLGLVFGRSGAGKTTLLQLVAGLAQQSSGSISFSGPPAAAAVAAGSAPATPGATLAAAAAVAAPASAALTSEERMAQAGLVFQFPERHFIGRTMSAELTVGWPVAPEQLVTRTALAQRTHQVLEAVGLSALPLDVPLAHLSDGYKR